MKLTKQETEQYRRFSKMNKSIHTCKIDQLNIHLNGEYEHEKAKFDLYWKLRKQGHRVITEAWERGTDFRRDVVDLTDGIVIEIEHSENKRGHRHLKEICVYWYDLKRYRTKEDQCNIL